MSEEETVPSEPADSSVAPATPAPQIAPLRIKKLTLCDFRAFAGPDPVPINFDGKNMLMFGENGAGKSSIFHALNELFVTRTSSPRRRKGRFSDFKNRFSPKDFAGGYIEVIFDDDETAARWDNNEHPVDRRAASKDVSAKAPDQRVVRGALQKAMLDYRSLLDTNYRHGDGEINLFDVCVQVLLRDYRALPYSNNDRLIVRWRDLERRLEKSQLRKADVAEINRLASEFSAGLREALDALVPKANSLLRELGWKDVELKSITTPGLAYNNSKLKSGRDFDGKKVSPELQFHSVSIPMPQNFLNEARLSALALAIYLAGRQVCADTLQVDTPRLMVLDDVLIGLDQSNRLPVLDILADHFKDWQVVLLTYDRTWFEMARSYHRRHKADRFWNYAKIHSDDDPTKSPIVAPATSSAAADVLAEGRSFLQKGHVNAAGNYARIAFELALREFCESKKILVAYQQLPEQTPASELLNAAKKFSTSKANGTYDAPLAAVEMYTSILLNKLSHGGVSTVTRYEVQGALNAVDGLLFALKVLPSK